MSGAQCYLPDQEDEELEENYIFGICNEFLNNDQWEPTDGICNGEEENYILGTIHQFLREPPEVKVSGVLCYQHLQEDEGEDKEKRLIWGL